MGYGYGGGAMSIFGPITWLVILVDLILLGAWLYKQINK